MSSDMDHFFRTQRRVAISKHPSQIGIDYVEYLESVESVEHIQPNVKPNDETPISTDYVEYLEYLEYLESASFQLNLYFIPAADGVWIKKKQVRPTTISTANVRILSESGLEQHSIRVTAVNLPDTPDNLLEVTLAHDQKGESELPVYTLQLREVPNLDSFFNQVDFSLQVDEPNELDPQTLSAEERVQQPTPEIDYLAKDYSSFRQLMLNRLSLLIPSWREPSPADLGHTLVEVLAYAADHTSYYQDAVATEAYLSTARRRVSVRRHTRLIDYVMHEGCNARVWVQVQVKNRFEITLPTKSKLLTQVEGLNAVLDEQAYEEALIEGATVFETMQEQTLFAEQNSIDFYTWGARECVLHKGSTTATLRGHFNSLKKGQILVFREVRGAMTGEKTDADPARRHAVRLIDVKPGEDPLGTLLDGGITEMTDITWHEEDALPFDFVISNRKNLYPNQVSVAHGNIVLADHGLTITNEPLIPSTVPTFGRYQPHLRHPNLTHSVPYDSSATQKASAAALFQQSARDAIPAITLTETDNESENEPQTWHARPDLLDSDRFTRAFVVEMESDRRATLRFGNGTQGKQPSANTIFTATYRVGNGLAGNVGQNVISHIFTEHEPKNKRLTRKVSQVYNWLPAQGGIDPEPISEARLYAPTAFQSQKRCVTKEDYVTIAKSHPDVQDAAAVLRWTGSWYTATVLVRRRDKKPINPTFQEKMLNFMDPYRVMGYDITVRGPNFVSLDIALTVHVDAAYFASVVKQMLLETFSAVDLPTGQRGFFHPDNFTFGQSVYLSQIISRAVGVEGVIQVVATRFQRWGHPTETGLEAGLIATSPLEIAQVQNESQAPQHGRIVFTMQGGR